jgi:hypothetical protein
LLDQVDQVAHLEDQVDLLDQCTVIMEVMEVLAMQAAQVDQVAHLEDQVDLLDQCKVLMEVMEVLAMRAAQVDQAALCRMAEK